MELLIISWYNADLPDTVPSPKILTSYVCSAQPHIEIMHCLRDNAHHQAQDSMEFITLRKHGLVGD